MRIGAYSPRWQARVSALADRVLRTGIFESPAQIQRDPESLCVCRDRQGRRGRRLRSGQVDRGETRTCEAVIYRKKIF